MVIILVYSVFYRIVYSLSHQCILQEEALDQSESNTYTSAQCIYLNNVLRHLSYYTILVWKACFQVNASVTTTF